MADKGRSREDDDTDSEGPGCQCGRPLCAECFQQDDTDSDGPGCECGRPFCADCFQQDVDGEDSGDIGEEDETSEDGGEDSGERPCHDRHQEYHYHHYDNRQQHFHYWQPPAYLHIPECVHPAPIAQQFAAAAPMAMPPAQYGVLPPSIPPNHGAPPQYLTEDETDEEDDFLPYPPYAWEQRAEQPEETNKKEKTSKQ